jgi:hypothetical protein
MRRSLWWIPAVLSLVACGGSKPNANGPSAPAASAAPAPPDAGVAPPAPAERPFAKTALEATNLIDDAIETRRSGILQCVQAARGRRHEPRARIEFELGIDQEGTLIGVKPPKGQKADRALDECVRDALQGAPFPRSTAGVVTVRKGFSDELVYPR